MNCPICENNISNDTFCQVCGFEHISIPSNASQKLKNFLQSRTDKFKKHYNDVMHIKSKAKELETTLSEAKNQITELSKIKNDLEKKIKATEGKVLVTQKEINDLLVFKSEYEKQIKQINDLQNEVKTYKSKMKNIDDYDLTKKQLQVFKDTLQRINHTVFSETCNKLKTIK